MQIGHVLVGFLSLVCVIFITSAIADGRSVIIMKAEALGPYNSALTQYRDGYGVGVFKDSRGNDWTDAAHPVEALKCDDHQKLGNTVKAFSLIACITGTFAVLVSLLGASGGAMFGMISIALQAVMFLSFLIAMAVGWNLVTEGHHCGALDADVTLDDYFELNYGLFFLIAGTVVSLLNIVILVATGALKGEEAASTENEPTAEVELEKKEEA